MDVNHVGRDREAEDCGLINIKKSTKIWIRTACWLETDVPGWPETSTGRNWNDRRKGRNIHINLRRPHFWVYLKGMVVLWVKMEQALQHKLLNRINKNYFIKWMCMCSFDSKNLKSWNSNGIRSCVLRNFVK